MFGHCLVAPWSSLENVEGALQAYKLDKLVYLEVRKRRFCE